MIVTALGLPAMIFMYPTTLVSGSPGGLRFLLPARPTADNPVTITTSTAAPATTQAIWSPPRAVIKLSLSFQPIRHRFYRQSLTRPLLLEAAWFWPMLPAI